MQGILLGSLHFSTIFFHTHILWHHVSSHYITPWIRWLLFVFPWKLQAKPRPWTCFQLFQVVPTHATFIDKWSLWDGFGTPSRLFSPWRFNEWIFPIVPTLFSYYTWPHSTPNCTCPWSMLLFSHDQTFKWSSSHCSGGTSYRLTSHVLRLQFLETFATFFPYTNLEL